MIYLKEKSADCDVRLAIVGKSTSVVAKTFHQIGLVPGQRM